MEAASNIWDSTNLQADLGNKVDSSFKKTLQFSIPNTVSGPSGNLRNHLSGE